MAALFFILLIFYRSASPLWEYIAFKRLRVYARKRWREEREGEKREQRSGLRFVGSLGAGPDLFGLGSFQGGCTLAHRDKATKLDWLSLFSFFPSMQSR